MLPLPKIISFFGSENFQPTEKCSKNLKSFLQNKIQNEGFNTFYFGSHGNFETTCLNIVKELKLTYKNIEIIFFYPYETIIFDQTKTPIITNDIASTLKRNKNIVLKSDFCICYLDEQNTNDILNKTISYIVEINKPSINIATQDFY